MDQTIVSVEQILADAVEIASLAERQAFVEKACAGNADLRAEVERLLANHDQAGSFLEHPAAVLETAVRPAEFDVSGTQIGSYKLLEQIGEGGMGVVYVAEQTQPIRRTVALKLIKPGMDTKQVIARFEAERHVLALMDHPNIAKVLDAGTTDAGRHYFVMELVRGIAISEYCDEARLTVRQRLELFVQVCRAVQHAHTKGIIHRDLKPSNVLVTSHDGVPVPMIIDFGVAKALERPLTDVSVHTGFAQMIGTPLYMSPEQAEFNQLGVDTRSDVYSLGVVLYELLTGTTPLERKRLTEVPLMEVLRLIREGETPRPSTRLSTTEELPTIATNRSLEPKKLNSLVRGELDWIVMKALEKDRDRRYESASDFAADVHRYLNDEPVQACPPSAAYRLTKFARRHKGAVLVATLLVLALFGTSIGLVLAVDARQAEAVMRKQAEEDERTAKAETRAKEEALATAAVMRKQAEENERKAKAETRAKEEALANAVQERIKAEKAQKRSEASAMRLAIGYDMIHYIFSDLDPRTIEKDGKTLRLKLADRLTASALMLETGKDDHPEVTARVLRTLGESLKALGYYDKAAVLLEKSLLTYRRSLPQDDPTTLQIMSDLGHAYQLAGKFDLAVLLQLEALEKMKAKLGHGHANTIEATNRLGAAYGSAGKRDSAILNQIEALAKLKAKRGTDHPDTLTMMNNLAVAYTQAGKADHAVPLFLEALDKQQRVLAANDPLIATTMGNLALAYLGDVDPDKAFKYADLALEKNKALLGAGHPHTLTTMNTLAMSHLARGELKQAMPLFQDCLEKRKAKLGPDHPSVIESIGNLAGAHRAIGDYDRAMQLQSQAYELTKAKYGADHPSTLNRKHNLGHLFLDTRKLEKANEIFREVRHLCIKILGPDHPLTLTTTLSLAQAMSAAGDLDSAMPLFQEALEKTKIARGAEHPQTANVLSVYGRNLLKHQKFVEAEPLLRDCLTIRLSTRPLHWTTNFARLLLGGSLVGQEKYAEAEPYLADSRRGMKNMQTKMIEPEKTHLIEVLERLVQLYDATARTKEASQWRQELTKTKDSLKSPMSK